MDNRPLRADVPLASGKNLHFRVCRTDIFVAVEAMRVPADRFGAAGDAARPARRVALVHDFLVDVRGAERVFAVMTDMWPDADVFTAIYDEDGTEGRFADRRVHTTFLQRVHPSARTSTRKSCTRATRRAERAASPAAPKRSAGTLMASTATKISVLQTRKWRFFTEARGEPSCERAVIHTFALAPAHLAARRPPWDAPSQ